MILARHFEKEMVPPLVVSDVRNICDIENQYHGQNLSKGNMWPHPALLSYSIFHQNGNLQSCKLFTQEAL